MRHPTWILILLCAGSAFLVSCERERQANPPVEHTSPDSENSNLSAIEDARDDSAPVVKRRSGLAASSSENKSTWQDYLLSLSVGERQALEAANQRFYGLLGYDSPDDYEMLIRAGFPSHDEWLRFEKMGDTELLSKVQAGDRMARLFHADRLAQGVEISPGKFGERTIEIEKMASDAYVQASLALRERQDPFAAYVYGKVDSARTGRLEPMAAAMMLAADRGDPRASNALRLLNDDHPDLRVDLVQSIYQMMKRTGRHQQLPTNSLAPTVN